MTYLRNKKGQSLTELAIFGTVLLGALGYFLTRTLTANYSENLNMQAFRYALEKAYQERKTYNNASVIVIDDKAFPEANNPLAIPSRLPIISSASAIWSNDLMLSWDKGDFGKRKYLPQVTIRVIDKAQAKGYREYNFTIAGWTQKDLTGITLKQKKDDDKDQYLIDGSAGSDKIKWYWKTVKKTKKNEYFDVDADNKEEFVLSGSKVMDFQDGEIDSSMNSSDLKKDILASQGFTGDYLQQKKIKAGTYLRKQENKQGILTARAINIEDNFYYLIKLNRITLDLVNQMQTNDIIWIDEDEDRIMDENEVFSQEKLKGMDVSGYDGKKQDIWFGINKKTSTQDYEQWQTTHKGAG